MHSRRGGTPRLSRDARLLVAASGVFGVSFFGILLLLKVLYVLRLGHGPEYVGLFTATSAFAYMGMSLPSGALGRRWGTRRVMLAGGIVTVLGMAALPLTEYLPADIQTAWPIASQVVVTAGWSMLNINLVPTLTAVTAGRNRNRAFAVNGALRGLGTFVGAVSGGLLPGLFANLLHATLDDPTPYGLALWVGAAVGVLGLIPLSAVGEAEPVRRGEIAGARGSFPVMPVTLMISYVCLRHGGWATSRAFYNAYVDTVLHLSASSIGLITGVAQFVAMLAALLTPRLASRRSNGWTLMVTTLGLVVSLLPLALVPHWGAAGLSQLGVLALSAIWMPAFQVFQMELVEPQWRSLSYGAVSMAMGFSFGLVSLLGGYVIAAGGYRSLFALGVVLTASSSAVIGYIHSRLDPERARSPQVVAGGSPPGA